MTFSPPIPVVCALIEKDGKLLIAQRPLDKHLAFKWEFPGGKMERHESPEEALVREIREELSCDIRILRPLPPLVHDYREKCVRLIPFLACLADQDALPLPKEHGAIRWLPPNDLKELDLAEADKRILQSYLASTFSSESII